MNTTIDYVIFWGLFRMSRMSVLCIFAIRLELDIFRVGSCILEIGLQDPNFVRLPSQTTLLSFTGAVLSCYRRVFKATSSSDDRKWHVISVSYDCFNGHWRDDFVKILYASACCVVGSYRILIVHPRILYSPHEHVSKACVACVLCVSLLHAIFV